MGFCQEQTGHVVIFLYFVVFGVAFEAASWIYLVNLNKIDKPHACIASLLTLTDPEPDLTTPCRVHMKSWKGIAVTGIVYGVICLLSSIFQLIRAVYQSSPTSTVAKTTLKVAGEKVSQVQQYVNKSREEEKRFWSCCAHFVNASVLFLVVMVVWLISLTIPAYLAVNLYRTDAIWTDNERQDDVIYYPALSLLVICIANFVVVVVTCVAVCMEKEEEDAEPWNVYKHYEPWDSQGDSVTP